MNTLQQEPQEQLKILDILTDDILIEINAGRLRALLATAREDVAQQCYLECLAVECGEGECARAIRTKFNLKGME